MVNRNDLGLGLVYSSFGPLGGGGPKPILRPRPSGWRRACFAHEIGNPKSLSCSFTFSLQFRRAFEMEGFAKLRLLNQIPLPACPRISDAIRLPAKGAISQ
jgi:hypothetical protein